MQISLISPFTLALLSVQTAMTLLSGTQAASAPKPDVVAMISGKAISNADLEEIGKSKLARIKAEELVLKRQILDEYLTNKVLADAAQARGLSLEEFQKLEVESRILAVTEDQKRAVFEAMPQAYVGKTEADAFRVIGDNLRSIRLAEARKKLVADLRRRAAVQVFLPAPSQVSLHPDRTQGTEAAQVTFVEYSDFQCPFCQKAYPIVKQLRETYKDRVRFVFKDFPLSIHPQAAKAAEAGACAGDQGRFWEMHQWMFENPKSLQVNDLKRAANTLRLDTGKFSECLDSSRYEASWREDIAEGQRLGVQATPTFLINGQAVVGAKSLAELTKILDIELQKPGQPSR
ncbi:MAG: thioredoxin domain-containing protein [Vicinamibacteria bacterium]